MKKLLTSLTIFIASLLSPRLAAAADAIPDPNNIKDQPVGQFNFFKPGTTGSADGAIDGIAERIMEIVLIVLTLAAVCGIIYAGIRYITSGGNADQTKKARATLVNIVLGVIILAGAYTIIAVILSLSQIVARGLK